MFVVEGEVECLMRSASLFLQSRRDKLTDGIDYKNFIFIHKSYLGLVTLTHIDTQCKLVTEVYTKTA
jgi:hypothetical protein